MKNCLVLQTDFGLADGAVSSMYGVAYMVDSELNIQDLTHDIPAYDIHSAGYRLYQSIIYWPKGTVFVSVVDPGVGGHRKSVVCETESGHYVITPDNGTLTYLYYYVGIKEIREINETAARLSHSSESHTFHGRDIYVYNGARLASGEVSFQELGEVFPVEQVEKLPVDLATKENDSLRGTVDILDIRFGSLWTNIPLSFVKDMNLQYNDKMEVTIFREGVLVYKNVLPFVKSFGEVAFGEPLLYINSLLNMAVAINQESFADTYGIGIGNDWKINLEKIAEQ